MCIRDRCQKCKHPNLSTRVEMQTIQAKEKGELLAMDYYGPLPKAKGGVKHILVTVDFFSKFVKLYPVQRATTKATLRALTKFYIPQYGKPREILSDQGKQFTHNLWRETLEELNIKPILTSIRHPQANLAE